MLKLVVNGDELWDEQSQEFITVRGQTLQLEHSLLSISKWEEKWKKPFLDDSKPKTVEEELDYIRCMTINAGNVDPIVYRSLTPEHFKKIHEYIEDPHTATTFREDKNAPKNRSITTAEIIYYQMTALNIPFECEKWHLNKLMTLIRVCAIKNAPSKKGKGKNKAGSSAATRELNRRRLAEMGTNG